MNANNPAMRPRPAHWTRTLITGNRIDGRPATLADFQEIRWWLHDLRIRAWQHGDQDMDDALSLSLLAVELAQQTHFPIPA